MILSNFMRIILVLITLINYANAESNNIDPLMLNTITVGSSISCQYDNLQLAVDAAISGDTIHVSAELFVGSSATVNISNKSLIIIGGYNSDCNTFDGTRTLLDGTGMPFSDSIIEISNSIADMTVLISNIDIQGGEDDADGGGAIEITGHVNFPLQVLIGSSLIIDNKSSLGAGIHLTDADLILSTNVSIRSNDAILNGGGVYCLNSQITVSDNVYIGSSFFPGNTATNGAGFYLDNCDLILGGESINTTGAYILANTASELGGGIFASNNSRIDLHGDEAWINDNVAMRGGGIYLSTGSIFYGDNGKINDNTAIQNGGGFYLIDTGSRFDMDRVNSYPCNGKCSELSNNTANVGGAGYLSPSTIAVIDSSWIESNSANNQSLAFFSDGKLTISSSMIVNQHASGTLGNVSDLFTIRGETIIKHSTIAGTEISAGSGEIFRLTGAQSTTLTLQNSIVRRNNSLFLDLYSRDFGQTANINNNILTFSHNEPGNMVVDPLFVAYPTDYHIQAGSPAIDLATTTSINDIDNQERNSDLGTDIGADEYVDIIFINGFE